MALGSSRLAPPARPLRSWLRMGAGSETTGEIARLLPGRGRGRSALAPSGSAYDRELLPALEPERRLDDWGRSERVEALADSTIIEFLYRHWFRCEVEGIENVPARGGALILANRGGAVAPAAAMIGRAIREEHPRPRRLYTALEHELGRYPGLAMVAAKLGCVRAHPANVGRLVDDEQGLVLAFPEGREAADKRYRERYRLASFDSGSYVEAAMRAGATLVPACVVGAEEAMPVLGRSRALGRLVRRESLPLTPTFPWLGPLGAVAPLPAKFKVRFLAPIETAAMGADPGADGGLVHTVREEVRGRMQEELREMVGRRRSVWRG